MLAISRMVGVGSIGVGKTVVHSCLWSAETPQCDG